MKFIALYSNLLPSGTPVRFVAHYIDCASDAHPRATGGSDIGVFEYFNDTRFGPQAFFSFSNSVLIANYQNPAFGQFLFDFVRTRVFANGTVQIEAEYLMTDSYKPVMDEVCTILSLIFKWRLFECV